jgi:predicted transcriptional regulator
MRAVEWNDFTDRLVDFRKYKTPTSVPSFTRVSSGSIVTAATINKAINEANVVVSPAIPRVSSGGTVYASTFQLLRDRLNAL